MRKKLSNNYDPFGLGTEIYGIVNINFPNVILFTSGFCIIRVLDASQQWYPKVE